MLRLRNTALAALVVVGASLGVARAEAPAAIVTPLMTQPLDDYPGKEALMISVEYPP
jgi:hypothetical protein